MRTIIITLILFLVFSSIKAQEGTITKVIDNQNIEINLGKLQGLSIGDKFYIYGKGQFLHPATGRMVEGDNIVIGEIEITEVLNNFSRARVINSKQTIIVNARIEKKGDDLKQDSDNPPPQAVNQPTYQKYYTGQTNSRKKDAKITSAEYSGLSKFNELNTYIVKIDKGKSTGFRRNFSYFVYNPIYNQSPISGDSVKNGRKKIGRLYITYREEMVSQGNLSLRKSINLPEDYEFDQSEVEFIKYRRISLLYHLNILQYFNSYHLGISYRINNLYSLGIRFRAIEFEIDDYDDNYSRYGEFIDFYGSLHYRLNKVIEPLINLGFSYTLYDANKDYLPINFELGTRFYLLNWLSIDLYVPLYPRTQIWGSLCFHMF